MSGLLNAKFGLADNYEQYLTFWPDDGECLTNTKYFLYPQGERESKKGDKF